MCCQGERPGRAPSFSRSMKTDMLRSDLLVVVVVVECRAVALGLKEAYLAPARTNGSLRLMFVLVGLFPWSRSPSLSRSQ